MTGKNTNKKMLIPLIIGMLILVAGLIFVIIYINRDENFNKGIETTTSNEISETKENDITGKTDDLGNNSLEDNNATPTTSGDLIDNNTDNNPENTVESGAVSVILGKYKGLITKYEPEVITDENIDSVLKSLQDDYTEIVDLPNRAFKNGDMAIVTFTGEVGGNEIDALSGVCLQVVIGSGIMPQIIEEDIIGRHIGDIFYHDIEYPEEYSSVPEAAGKIVHFTLELEDGFMFEVPDITDEFINKVTEYTSVAEYRSKEKERLQTEADEKAKAEMIRNLKDQIIDGCSFSGPIDDEIKKKYVQRLQEENNIYMENYYMDAATYYSLVYDITVEEFRNSLMDDAAFQTKYEYAIKEIMKQENLQTVEEAEQLIIDSSIVEE
jgi:trigger factor